MPAMSPSDLVWSQIIAPTLNAFALAGSLIGVLIGAGLLLGTQDTLLFFRRINRNVSMRRALKPLEIPRIIERPGRRHPWVGIAFMLGGAYAAIALLTQLDAAKTVAALGITRNPVTAEVLIDTLRWFLIVGGLAGVALGVILIFMPRVWAAVEAKANRWVSTRRMYTGGDEMHLGLDRWVESSPRAAGVIIGVSSLVAAGAFAILLFGRL
jgi:hypothetical protein